MGFLKVPFDCQPVTGKTAYNNIEATRPIQVCDTSCLRAKRPDGTTVGSGNRVRVTDDVTHAALRTGLFYPHGSDAALWRAHAVLVVQ